jgi:hypothetical protein
MACLSSANAWTQFTLSTKQSRSETIEIVNRSPITESILNMARRK